MSTQTCTACNTRLRADARFCGNCGAKLPQAGQIEASTLVGQVVAGAYRVESILGTGSMGVVYRAEQIALSRPVALKVIGEATDDDTTRARFRREARASSQLGHPNVVQIYDFGQLHGGQPYLAMELLDGRTLEQIIEDEFPIEIDRVFSYMTDVLSALQAAHDKGILHRDLKPANVIVSTLPDMREVAKVLDFGIATAMDGTQTSSKTWAPLTEAGFVCGTPAFMSPEQVQGLPLDQRSDLFSAAGLIYQMLTGERPFPGKSPVEVGANIVLKPLVPPTKAHPELGLPIELDAFLLKAMAKKAENRFDTALEMIEALHVMHRKILAQSGESPVGSPIRRATGKHHRIPAESEAVTQRRLRASQPSRAKPPSTPPETEPDQPVIDVQSIATLVDHPSPGEKSPWVKIEVSPTQTDTEVTSTRTTRGDLAKRRILLKRLLWVLGALLVVALLVMAWLWWGR